MKMIVDHMAEILITIASVALIIGVILAFSGPLGDFFNGLISDMDTSSDAGINNHPEEDDPTGESTTLSPPTLSITGSTLIISEVTHATSYEIYVDGVFMTTVTSRIVNLSALGLGTGSHTVVARAKAVGYTTSQNSNSVNYVVESESLTITKTGYTGTYDGQAHGITVVCDGATITYALAENGEYSATNPTYTDAGTYTVWYKVEKAGYDTVAGSEEVTIYKAENTLVLSATSGTLTYPATGIFTIDTNVSGGALSVTSSNESVAKATLTDNELTITSTRTGTATITITSAETANYKSATVTYAVTVVNGTLGGLTASGYTGTYDGKAHSITVTCAGATITYSTSENGEYSATNPTYTDAGTYTVWYKVEKSGYDTVIDSATVVINRAKITTIPSQSGTLTYSGNAQSPTWSDYNSTQLTLGGTTSGTNAGSYNVTFTPKANYTWSDGTTTAKTATWLISKAAGKVGLSAASGTLTYPATGSFTVDVNTSGGTLTIISFDTNVAKVSINSNVATITPGTASGTTTIVVTSAETLNYEVATATYTVTVNNSSGRVDASGKILDSWEMIAASTNDGTYKTKYEIGDYKPLTLKDGTTVNMQIAVFNGDTATEGGKATITWVSKEVLPTQKSMNSTATNASGWASSGMRTYLANDVWALIPTEVQNAIVAVDKTYYDYTTKGTKTSSDKLWIPSYREVFGDDEFVESSGVIYSELFTEDDSRVKYNKNSVGQNWWLRSATYYNNTYFQFVTNIGEVSDSMASGSAGVVLCFCTGVTSVDEIKPGEISDSWDEIIAAVNDGTYKQRYTVGAYKPLKLADGTTVKMQIAAIDGDDITSSGGKAAITWIAQDLLATKHNMNSTSTSTGGWASSDMRSYLKNDVWALIPSEVQNAIVAVDKTYYDYTSRTTLTSSDKVWIPSWRELGIDTSREDFGVIYGEVFSDNISRQKALNGEYVNWWLRSAENNGGYFTVVSSNGGLPSGSAMLEAGIVLCFCM